MDRAMAGSGKPCHGRSYLVASVRWEAENLAMAGLIWLQV
jgi:hypothetical protein